MKKPQIADGITRLFADAETYPFENRIFNLVMLLVSLAALITTTYCIILDDNIILTASSVAVVLLSSIVLAYACKTGKYRSLVKPVLLSFMVLMIVTWIANDGLKGATSYFIFVLMTIGILLLKKPFPIFIVISFALLAGLLAVDFFYPSILIGYQTKTQQFLDISISLFVCLFFNSLIIFAVVREYLRERSQKDALLAQTISDKQELEQAHKELKILRGILPICAGCKKIKDQTGDWSPIEDYISKHSEAELTHGICPDCLTQLYPELESKSVQLNQ